MMGMRGPHSFFHIARLSDVENGRDNNLNVIRFLLASMVILNHSYVSMGLYSSEPMHRWIASLGLGSVAVYGFFFISGYLILKSALNRSPEDFIAARVLRIFPGLIVTVLLCVFLVGPLISTVSAREYFSSPLTWSYLSEMWMHRMQHLLPGVCLGDTLPSINAPLWTLPGEWTMYMAALVACLFARWRSAAHFSARTWIILIGGLALTAQMMPLPWAFATEWIKFFVIGSIVYLARRWVLLSLPAAAIVLAANLILLHFHPHAGLYIFQFSLCYFLVTFGYHPAAHVKFFHRFGDYSYGLYIYGQPIQQSLLHRFDHPVPFFVAAYPLVLGVAVLSWHYIEKPAISIKGKERRRKRSMVMA
jgi:peptidoglycan/LPS O-acetylase OafA/YrhL